MIRCKKPGCEHIVLSLVFVRSYNFGWWPAYDCKAYLETNTVKNCSYFGLVDIFGFGNNWGK